jgi:prepilin-type N-terminal cleavage/methylation domain-containing protein
MYSHTYYKKGFTLVEVVMTVAIFTLVSYALFTSIETFYTYNAYSIAQAHQVDQARRGMEILVRDIREMTFADNGAFPLTVMEPHRIAFFSDIDRDESVEYVEYTLASTTIEKKIFDAVGNPPVYATTSEATHILSRYVQNITRATSTFIYYDQEGNPANASTTVTDIAYVRVQIIVNIDENRDPGQFMLRSSAALRNLKEGL